MTRLSVTARLTIAAAAMTVVLVAMVGAKQYTLETGTQIQLETRPVDPRSLFRGDYVRLRYVISLLDLNDLPGDKEFETGDAIYVVLKPGDPYWTPVSVHRSRPEAGNGEVVIKGRVAYHWKNPGTGKVPPRDQIDATYGIESYFVPEGEGRELEDPSQIGRISILAAVDRFGNAAIKQVLVDGEPRFTEKLF